MTSPGSLRMHFKSVGEWEEVEKWPLKELDHFTKDTKCGGRVKSELGNSSILIWMQKTTACASKSPSANWEWKNVLRPRCEFGPSYHCCVSSSGKSSDWGERKTPPLARLPRAQLCPPWGKWHRSGWNKFMVARGMTVTAEKLRIRKLRLFSIYNPPTGRAGKIQQVDVPEELVFLATW